MELKGIKRMVLGEKMPDKNDPQYKERYEQDVRAGKTFAKTMRIDRAAAAIQRFANGHRTAFLVIVFGFVVLSFGWNVYRLSVVCQRRYPTQTAIERQDSILRQRHKPKVHPIVKHKNQDSHVN